MSGPGERKALTQRNGVRKLVELRLNGELDGILLRQFEQLRKLVDQPGRLIIFDIERHMYGYPDFL